jgi:uncharacterized protein (TIGR02118 family)
VAARLIVLYSPPDDPAAFDEHYRQIHTPIVRRYPGLRDLRLTRPDGVAGRDPAFYLMAEMAFDSRADLDAALASDAGRESGMDLRNFAGAGVTLLIADDEAAFDA